MLSLLALLLMTGCGPERPKTVPVTGKVTFGGGAPPAAGSLMFAPLEAAEGYSLRPAYGSFDAQGNVTVSTYAESDGLLPGRYEVKVECWRVPPTEETAGESYLPANFTAAEVVVPESADQVPLTIDVPLAK